MQTRTVLVAVLLTIAAGCGRSGGSADTTASFGKPIKLDDGNTITLSNPRLGGDQSRPWIEIDVRFTNSSSQAAQPPGLEVACHEASQGSGYLAGSTFDPYAEVRAGITTKGELQLLPTGNERTGHGVDQCAAPAEFRIGDTGPTIDLPAQVLAAYNAKANSATG